MGILLRACVWVAVVGGWVGAAAAAPEPLRLTEGLLAEGAAAPARAPVPIDAVLHALATRGVYAPVEGETLAGPGGRQIVWKSVRADDLGRLGGEAARGSYVLCRVESAAAQDAVLQAVGHSVVYVNGEARAGDPYATGAAPAPIRLRAGSNELLFALAGRGRLEARIAPPPAPVFVAPADSTVPDLLPDGAVDSPGAVTVVNTTDAWARGLVLGAKVEVEGATEVETAMMPIPPRTVVKARLTVRSPAAPPASLHVLTVRLRRAPEPSGDAGEVLHEAAVSLRVRDRHAPRRETFVSEIDGSVQYYGIQRATGSAKIGEAAGSPAGGWGLALSLHGASVEATSQVEAYGPSAWRHVVAPTNRRPFGFDWEEWGRKDALEVLDLALADPALGIDPRRVMLTGHSMGGHGTWHLGVHYPDRFAAIAPSAGWASFLTYGGVRGETGDDAVLKLFRRAFGPSDTAALARNLDGVAVSILHGDADDNVPPEEARRLAGVLKEFHTDWRLHEEPKAGHWWDSGAWAAWPGAACLDWPPFAELHASRRSASAAERAQARFSTMHPGVASKFGWAEIVQQMQFGERSGIDLRRRTDGEALMVEGTTENVARLRVWPPAGAEPRGLVAKLDGGEVRLPAAAMWELAKRPDGWRAAAVLAGEKRPERCGPFKAAFDRRFVLVCPTGGSDEENAAGFAAARHHAETWWYRGNGAAEIVLDSEIGRVERDRNVILYGCARTNRAWATVLGQAPLEVMPGRVRVGPHVCEGEALVCVAVYPRAGSDAASAGVIGVTGARGYRLAERLPIFTSGATMPDVMVVGPEGVLAGPKGARLVGFFGNDWGVESGEWAGADAGK